MTVHSEKPPFISTPYKLWKAPMKASAKSFDGTGADVCFGFLKSSAPGFSSAVSRSLSSHCVLSGNKLFLQRQNIEERT